MHFLPVQYSNPESCLGVNVFLEAPLGKLLSEIILTVLSNGLCLSLGTSDILQIKAWFGFHSLGKGIVLNGPAKRPALISLPSCFSTSSGLENLLSAL